MELSALAIFLLQGSGFEYVHLELRSQPGLPSIAAILSFISGETYVSKAPGSRS